MLATSSRSPPMDFTGYRKIASTCPISISMLDVSPIFRNQFNPIPPRIQNVTPLRSRYLKIVADTNACCP